LQLETLNAGIRTFSDMCIVFIQKGYDIYAGTSALDDPSILEETVFRTYAINIIFKGDTHFRSLFMSKLKMSPKSQGVYVTNAFIDSGAVSPNVTMRVLDSRYQEVRDFIASSTIKTRYTLPLFLK